MARNRDSEKAIVKREVAFGEVEFAKLKKAAYNPRDATPEQLKAICVSIAEFGIVDPFVARAEDLELLGGHQRHKAIEKLLEGSFSYAGGDGKKKAFVLELPGGKVPTMLVSGLDAKRSKLLNLALNKATGDWDVDALARMMRGLEQEDLATPTEMTFSGFSPAEIADYVDLAAELEDEVPPEPDFGEGEHPVPKPSKKTSLVLEFATEALRDAVVAALAAKAEDGERNGDVLAGMLGVVEQPKAPKKRAEAKKKKGLGRKK